MSFVGKASPNTDIQIHESGFWPGFSTNSFRSSMRILDSISNEQVIFSLKRAIDNVIGDLEVFEKKNKTDIVTKLHEVDMRIIAGDHQGVLKFTTAVFSEAKAILLETFRDMDLSRKAGQDQAEKDDAYIRELRRDSISAIRELLGKTAVFVELV